MLSPNIYASDDLDEAAGLKKISPTDTQVQQTNMGDSGPEKSFFTTLGSVKRNVIHSNVEESRNTLAKRESNKALSPKHKTSITLETLESDEGYRVQLYENVLYALHNYPKDNQNKIKLLKEALQISEEKHNQMQEAIHKTELPEWNIHVKVCEAKELKAMDPNGLSEPYCTLHLSSKSDAEHRTSIQVGTLTPVWNEDFVLTSKNINDKLTLSVWDWEKDKSLLETAGQIKEVKNYAGLKSYVRQIKHGRRPSAADSEYLFMGKINIPVKEMLGEKIIKWYPIRRKKKLVGEEKQTGSVLLETHVTCDVKHRQVKTGCIEEHENLTYLLLRQYYMTNDIEEAEEVLRWHASFYGLLPLERSICRWFASWTLHQKQEVETKLLLKSLLDLSYFSDKSSVSPEMKSKLSESLHTCFKLNLEIIKTVHLWIMKKSTLAELQRNVQQVKILKELFSELIQEEIDIDEEVIKTLHEGNRLWFDQQLALEEVDAHDDYIVLKANNCVLDAVLAVLNVAEITALPLFTQHLGIDVYRIMYKDFEEMILTKLETTVQNVCKNINDLFKKTEEYKESEEEIGATVFFCYFALQELIKKGGQHSIEPGEVLANCHEWFKCALYSWLPMASSKAQLYIKKAVELDDWKTITDHHKYSSSVTDALYIMSEIEKFWQLLAWPGSRSKKMFLSNLIIVIHNLSQLYGSLIEKEFNNVIASTKGLSSKLLVMLNNLEKMRDSLSTTLLPSLKPDNEDGSILSPAMQGKFTQLIRQLDNTLVNLICAPVNETLSTLHEKQDYSHHCSTVFHTFDDTMRQLYCELSENKLPFLFDNLWNSLLDIIKDLITIKDRKQEYYQALLSLLRDMKELFYAGGVGLSIELLESTKFLKIREKLYISSLSTQELISMFYKNRYSLQDSIQGTDKVTLGHVTLKTKLNCSKSQLEVEVLNCRNLTPADYSDEKRRHVVLNKLRKKPGTSDPYIKLQIVPSHLVTDKCTVKTKTQPNTLFPIFDECFTLDIPKEHSKEAFLVASVWDHDSISFDDFLGEALLPVSHMTEDTTESPQQHLPLTQSGEEVSEIKEILTHREDPVASAFLKKQKKLMITTKRS